MKKPESNEPSPFSSSSHDAGLTSQPVPSAPSAKAAGKAKSAGNVPDSVRQIMAANEQESAVRQSKSGGLPVVTSSYQASGKVGPYAFVPMLLATLAGALLTGAIYFFLAPHFNYILVTQAYVGALMGGAVWLGAKVARARSSRYAATFAVVGTLLLFAVYHSANVWQEREAQLDYFASALSKSSGASVATTRARLAQKLTFARATQFYWRDNYEEGVTLSDHDSSARGGMHLVGAAYLALVIFEIGFTALIAAAVASSATQARFSETQGRWYSRKRAFAVGERDVWPVLSALQAGDFARAREIAGARASKTAAGGQVYWSRVAGETGGWVEMTVMQDKKSHLLYEANVADDALRALGLTI